MLRSIFALLLLTGSAWPAYGYTFYSYAAGKRFATTVTDEALKKAPTWKADADNPPLSARKAQGLADAVQARLLKGAKNGPYKLQYLVLEPLGEGRWIWKVQYQSEAGSFGIPPKLTLAVLMDGTVVEPVVTNDRIAD